MDSLGAFFSSLCPGKPVRGRCKCAHWEEAHLWGGGIAGVPSCLGWAAAEPLCLSPHSCARTRLLPPYYCSFLAVCPSSCSGCRGPGSEQSFVLSVCQSVCLSVSLFLRPRPQVCSTPTSSSQVLGLDLALAHGSRCV